MEASWLILFDLPVKHGDFPVRYVRLLTGNTATHSSPQCFRSNNGGNYSKLRGSLCFGTHFGGKAIKNDEPRVLSDWTTKLPALNGFLKSFTKSPSITALEVSPHVESTGCERGGSVQDGAPVR